MFLHCPVRFRRPTPIKCQGEFRLSDPISYPQYLKYFVGVVLAFDIEMGSESLIKGKLV